MLNENHEAQQEAPANQRQQQKLATRKRILETAKQLFIEQGFESTSTRAIAKAAGVAVGTLFVHYPDKTALLIDALFNDIDQVFNRAIETMPTSGIVDQLSHLASSRLDYYLHNQELGRIALQHMLLQPVGASPQREQRAEQLVALAQQLVEKAIEKGELSPAIDSQVAAHAFAAQYLSVIIAGLRYPTARKEQLIDSLKSVIRQQLQLN